MHTLRKNFYCKKYHKLNNSEKGWKIVKKDKAKTGINKDLIQRRQIYCGNYEKLGYNARIYKIIIESFNKKDLI